MKNAIQSRLGFTLIELLVVVLIIGILSAVALPQYQKAVWKSRMTQVDTIINTFQKSMDSYLLANGYPEDVVNFAGTTSVGDIIPPGDCNSNGRRCYLKNMEFMGECYKSDGQGVCSIEIVGQGGTIFLRRYERDMKWHFTELASEDFQRAICQWGKDKGYPAVKNMNTIPACERLGVDLEAYSEN